MIKKSILGIVTSLILVNSAIAVENKVYAVVNGEKITSQNIAVALKNPKVKFDTLDKKTKKNILTRIVEQKLLAQKAIKTDVTKSKLYLDTLKSLKQDLALQIWMQKLSKDIKVSKDEVKKFYEKNKHLFKVPTQLKARHILVKSEKEAKQLIQTLKKSKNLKSKFIALAKEKSEGPSGKNGGDLGWFSLDKMVPAFSKAANKLKIGAITTKPVKTQFGYHIIYLEDKKNASTATLEQAKLQIAQELGKEKFIKKIQKIVDDLKKKAKIEYK